MNILSIICFITFQNYFNRIFLHKIYTRPYYGKKKKMVNRLSFSIDSIG